MKRVVAVAMAIGCAATAAGAHAYCPSYTPAETAGGQRCAINPANGHNPDVSAWKTIFATVAPGQSSWGNSGPSIGNIGAGCGKPTAPHPVPARFPCHVLKAIAMQESGWRQFCVPDAPQASVGSPERTIVSFDCGYGVGQVTSGMHVGENPSFDRNRVASDPLYNLATGTLILHDKWNATNCVGDNNPDLVEDWYTAIWAYNGLSYSNNPNNPNLTAGRGPYNPANGGSYAYQEMVLGWMEHPPSSAHWAALAPAYPNRGDIGNGSGPPDLPEPNCASPTSCTNKRPTHTSACDVAVAPDGGAPNDAGSSSDAGAPSDGADAGASHGGGISGGPGNDGVLASADTTSDTNGRCSCRAAGGRASPMAWALGLVLAGVLALRRKRRFVWPVAKRQTR